MNCTANGGLDVAGDPLDEVGRILVLDLIQNQYFGRRKISNFESKIKISGLSRSLISDFGVSKSNSRGIRKTDFNFRAQNSVSVFGPHLDENFQFFRVVVQNFPSHLPIHPKYFSNFQIFLQR